MYAATENMLLVLFSMILHASIVMNCSVGLLDLVLFARYELATYTSRASYPPGVGGSTSMQSIWLGSSGSGMGKGSRPSISIPVVESTHLHSLGEACRHWTGQKLEEPSITMQHTLESDCCCREQLVPKSPGIESTKLLLYTEDSAC